MSAQEFIDYVKKGVNRDELKQYRAKKKEESAVAEAIKTIHNNSIPAKSPEEIDALNEFRVLVGALVCDQQLTHGEFEYLCEWLRKHDHLTEAPVVSQIFDLAAGILEDGVITHNELDEMLRMLEAYSS